MLLPSCADLQNGVPAPGSFWSHRRSPADKVPLLDGSLEKPWRTMASRCVRTNVYPQTTNYKAYLSSFQTCINGASKFHNLTYGRTYEPFSRQRVFRVPSRCSVSTHISCCQVMNNNQRGRSPLGRHSIASPSSFSGSTSDDGNFNRAICHKEAHTVPCTPITWPFVQVLYSSAEIDEGK